MSNCGFTEDSMLELRKRVLWYSHTIIFALSVGLIAFISYDILNHISFMEHNGYMTFQLIVCLVFIVDFFVELWLTSKQCRWRYVRARWMFLLLSIPYLNLVAFFDIPIHSDIVYFTRFMPFARGGLALAIILGYITSNRITGIFLCYLSILLLTIYFSGLIFYERESPVNPEVKNYCDAFWWCGLEATTLGSSLNPQTMVGKLLAVVLSVMGIIMFPLFTVYLSSLILKSRDVLNIFNHSKTTVKNLVSGKSSVGSGEERVGETARNA